MKVHLLAAVKFIPLWNLRHLHIRKDATYMFVKATPNKCAKANNYHEEVCFSSYQTQRSIWRET